VHPGPEYSVADVHRGWLRGLADIGVEVGEYNLHDRLNFFARAHIRNEHGEFTKALKEDEAVHLAAAGLKQACYDWWPDVVVIISGFFIHSLLAEIMRARGHKVVMVMTESPYEDDRQLEQADGVDAVVLNDPTNIDLFRAANPNTIYLPHCYDPDLHHPGPSDFKADCAFVGTGFPSRVEFMSQVDWSGIDLALAGNWLHAPSDLERFVVHDKTDCLPNERTADVYRGALTSFNLYRTESQRPELADGWAMGPREVELAASGCWFARQSRPEGDELFPMLPIFETPDELGDQIRWALANPDQRRDAASRARAAVADRTFDANAKRLLSLLGV
jgi:spore maturation protein CgeB